MLTSMTWPTAMVHKNVDISVTVKSLRRETPDHLSLILTRPPRSDYEAGDWIDLAFASELSGGKTYLLSSASTEADLMITFKKGQGGVKRALQASNRATSCASLPTATTSTSYFESTARVC